MTTRAGAILMAVLLALYVVLVGWRAVQFIATGEPAAVGIGIALIVLPIIAAWALWRELAFGVRSQALMRRLEAEGGLDLGIPVKPSGRPERAARGCRVPRVPRGGRGRARLLARLAAPRPRLRRGRRPPPRARRRAAGDHARARGALSIASSADSTVTCSKRKPSSMSRCGRTFWLDSSSSSAARPSASPSMRSGTVNV